MALAPSALDGSDPSVIAQAADRLAQGLLVAFPTETVYGLGARADSDIAVAGIFAAKGRPADHPLIVHVEGEASALPFARRVPDSARRMMAAFWPGPLTLILPRAEGLGAAAAGGQDSIGLRCPSHPVAQALLRAALARGVMGVAAPSANRFGKVSPTRAAHVLAEFGALVPVLDGGASALGIESTIVDCTRARLVLLRPGMLTALQIEAAAGERVHAHEAHDAQAPRASGLLASHYAPRARVRLMAADAMQREWASFIATWQAGAQSPDKLLASGAAGPVLAVYCRTAWPAARSAVVQVCRMPLDAAAVAHELFAMLRAFDEQGVSQIWVEEPPSDPLWDGVRDRLQRAAA